MSAPSSGPAATPPPRTGNVILWIVLILSLAANAFLVAYGFRHGLFASAGPGDAAFGPRAFWNEAPPHAKAIALKELHAHRADLQKQAGNFAASRKAVLDAMEAEPFDAAAYRSALEQSADTDSQARQQAIGILVDIMAQLDPSERKEIAERLKERASHAGGGAHPFWHGGHGHSAFGPGPPPGGPPPQGPPPGDAQGPPAPGP